MRYHILIINAIINGCNNRCKYYKESPEASTQEVKNLNGNSHCSTSSAQKEWLFLKFMRCSMF